MGKLRVVEISPQPSEQIKAKKEYKATALEKRVHKFLKDLGLKDVDGGPNFKPGGVQVDAIGGFEDKLLIIECTTRRSPLREKIKAFKGVANSIRQGLRSQDPYKHTYGKYDKGKNIRFIITTTGKHVSPPEREFAEGELRISIWDEPFLNYYENLVKDLGEYAKYNLLGELGLTPQIKDTIKIPAFAIQFDRASRFYAFFVEPQDLLKFTYVARREIGRELYYQRILSRDRIKKIRKFLEDGGFFPNNIIISINEHCDFQEIKDFNSESYWPNWLSFGMLTFPATYRSCWLVDGQHRLYAFAENQTQKVPVTAFERLELERQAKYFIEINKEQRQVDRNLLWDISSEIMSTKIEGIISSAVKLLDDKGVFQGQINIPSRGRKRKKLKILNFCETVKDRKLAEERTEKMRQDKKNPLFHKDPHERAKRIADALNEYFSLINEVFGDKEKLFLFENSGVAVMITVYERLLAIYGRIPPKEDLLRILSGLKAAWRSESEEFFKSYRRSGSSEAGRSQLIKEILNILVKETPGLREFLIEDKDIGAEFAFLERSLRRFVRDKLEGVSKDWLKKRIPGDVYKKLHARARTRGGEPADFLTLGESWKVIELKDNWDEVFREVFVGPEKEFLNDSLFWGAVSAVNEARNKVDHGRGTLSSKEEKSIREYLAKFIASIS